LVILAKHGLITWGTTSDECYASTIATIQQAKDFVEARITANTSRASFGGLAIPALESSKRQETAAAVSPVLRGLVSEQRRHILHFEDTDDVLQFAGSIDAPRLVEVGAACPDHLVHTKPWPLLVSWTPEQDEPALESALRAGVAGYSERYRAYLEDNAKANLDPDALQPVLRPQDAPPDPFPRVILIPGIGMFTTGKDARSAEISAELYHRAVAVMRGAEACGGFISLSKSESYEVEYWPLEQYKLKLAPPEREFSRQIVLVTGAAGGIGSAISRRVARDGAQVVLTDIDLEGARRVAQEITEHGGQAVALRMDVTDESSVRTAIAEAALAFGGLDCLVNNAGLASSARVTETSLAEWQKTWSVLVTGYFLVAREGFSLLEKQGRGGSLVFIASKNALVAGKNASAYSTAKAAEAHLARCLAEEGGQLGIRVNTVNPDAVLTGSRIWDSSWRAARAATYGVAPDQLEEVYRQRTTLGVNIVPDDIAEAVAFFASPTRAPKSTGNILNVDGGVAAAYPR
jgi:rhamnulose-1-phosphate aldolase/alcohol dehydrogenase